MIISPPILSMKVLRISSKAEIRKIHELLPEDALIVDSGKVSSSEELELAYRLAKESFENKRNIAKKFRYEFLLWLSGKTDINSALKSSSPSKPDNILLILFKGEPKELLKKLKASEKPLKLKKRAEPLDIERISLSRIRN